MKLLHLNAGRLAEVDVPTGGGGDKTLKQKIFTTSGTWTRPSGVDSVQVFLVGGGGGGYCFSSSPNGLKCCGGGGEVRSFVVPVITDVTITIGAGGSSYYVGSGTASDGGDTSFGPVSARGGKHAISSFAGLSGNGNKGVAGPDSHNYGGAAGGAYDGVAGFGCRGDTADAPSNSGKGSNISSSSSTGGSGLCVVTWWE